jgi:2-oxoglutarate ferredoxin oxidoreductase subunit gamma
MQQYEVTFAGFGGQGILAIGQILAKACMDAGKHVVWIPSYGPEMRGGTAYCTVVVSEREIGSPIISNPTCAAVLNRPSFDKFSPMVKPDGLLLVNSSLIDVKSDRKDIGQLLVPCNDIAIKAGSARATNMAMLGAFVARSKLISTAAVRAVIGEKFKSKEKVLKINFDAFDQGVALGG